MTTTPDRDDRILRLEGEIDRLASRQRAFAPLAFVLSPVLSVVATFLVFLLPPTCGGAIDDETLRSTMQDALDRGDPFTRWFAHSFLLQHADPRVRAQAARNLAEEAGYYSHFGPQLVDCLRPLLRDTSADVIVEAIAALGAFGELAWPAVADLGPLAQDERPRVAEKARAALAAIRGG